MDCELEKILVNQIIAQKTENFIVEDNIIIPDIKPDILSIIRPSANVYIYKKELNNGKIKIDGGVKIDIIYLADNEQNNIRALHTILDFSKTVEFSEIQEANNADCSLEVKNIEPKILNGRKMSMQVNMELKLSLFSNKEKEFVKSINCLDDVQMMSDTLVVNSLKGFGETVSLAKDTVSIEDNLADILGTNIYVRNKETKVSYNKVLTKANVIVEMMYLSEDEHIKKVTADIPIMGFVDIQGVSDKELCTTAYEMRNIDIRPNDVDEHSINIEVEFLIKCDAYEEKEISLIRDLYSPENEIATCQEQVDVMQNKICLTDSCEVKEKINFSEIKDNKILDIFVVPRVIKQNTLNNSITYECELDCSLLYESNVTSRLEEKMQKFNFTHIVNSDRLSKDSTVNTCLEVNSKDYTCTADNMIDINMNVGFEIQSYVKNTVNLISSVDIKKYDDCKSNSLVIYFVKDGDSLWKIAKKFRSTMDDIAKVNGIENVDNIKVGQQLFIPRYFNAQI